MDVQRLLSALTQDDATTVKECFNESSAHIDSLLNVEISSVGMLQWTSLFLAAVCGSIRCMECLLDLGADPNVEDSDGDTPLNVASGLFPWAPRELDLNRRDALRILLDGHAAINHRSGIGQTALMIACYNEKLDAVSVLLSRYADVTLRDYEEQSAMNLAKFSQRVRQGHVPNTELVRMLLRAGADSRDFYGDGFFLTVRDVTAGLPAIVLPENYTPAILENPTLGTMRVNPQSL